MNNDERIKRTDVVILCGGKGKRLRSIIKNRPKSMIEFSGKPFLSILMEYANRFGFRRFILCLGYKADIVKEYYSGRIFPWQILYSEEKKSLGTGGALRNAEPLIQSEQFLVMNGDSFCSLDLKSFLSFHVSKSALLSIALANNTTADKNFGEIAFDKDYRIISFRERESPAVGRLVNSGIYFMNKRIFNCMGEKNIFSLEYDLLPRILNEKCYTYSEHIDLIDLGTPGGYKKAKEFFIST